MHAILRTESGMCPRYQTECLGLTFVCCNDAMYSHVPPRYVGYNAYHAIRRHMIVLPRLLFCCCTEMHMQAMLRSSTLG